jgi:hypothetical protein
MNGSMKLLTDWVFYFSQRHREIAPLFSVANSKQEFQALLITKGGVRDDVGNEKHAKFVSFHIRKGVFKYFHLHICKLEWF